VAPWAANPSITGPVSEIRRQGTPRSALSALNLGDLKMGSFTCPAVGSFPDKLSDKLPRGVPPVERPPTSFPVDPKQATTYGPSAVTWYFPINLPGTNPTGVFIPKGFAYETEVDVILFFHGNKIVDGNRDFTYINQYWHGNMYKVGLRDDLNTAGKNALLVAPTMGDYPGASLTSTKHLGIFATPGGGSCFLSHVMQWLGKYEDRYASNKVIPKVRKVVLAGHSGGGNPIHQQMEDMKAQVCEIWCFDVVYGNVVDWWSFAFFNQTKPVKFFHAVQSLSALAALKKLTADREKSLGVKLNNLEFIDAGKHHYPALTNNFLNQVRTSKCLK
jgi:hypothetical protein